jgi:hypothetical protein
VSSIRREAPDHEAIDMSGRRRLEQGWQSDSRVYRMCIMERISTGSAVIWEYPSGLTGTTKSGQQIEVRGVDLLEFAGGKITRKDSFWKILE